VEDAEQMVEILEARYGSICARLQSDFAQLRSCLWFGEDSKQGFIQTLQPLYADNKKKVTELLREALTLHEALQSCDKPGLLEKLLPKRWKQYQSGLSSVSSQTSTTRAGN